MAVGEGTLQALFQFIEEVVLGALLDAEVAGREADGIEADAAFDDRPEARIGALANFVDVPLEKGDNLPGSVDLCMGEGVLAPARAMGELPIEGGGVDREEVSDTGDVEVWGGRADDVIVDDERVRGGLAEIDDAVALSETGGRGGEGVDAEDGRDGDEADATSPGEVLPEVDGLASPDRHDRFAGRGSSNLSIEHRLLHRLDH